MGIHVKVDRQAHEALELGRNEIQRCCVGDTLDTRPPRMDGGFWNRVGDRFQHVRGQAPPDGDSNPIAEESKRVLAATGQL
jgi:hypothetical protein